MARKTPRKSTTVGTLDDPDGMAAWTKRFLQSLRVRGFSEYTLAAREGALRAFIAWLDTRSITKPVEVSKAIVESYQRHLYHRRKTNGRPLSFPTQRGALVAIRMFFRWLARQNAILANPAADLELPKAPFRLPRQVLTAAEAETVLSQPDTKTLVGLRDRAILEVFYSTGMRRFELVRLGLYDIDAERGTVLIKLGKGAKDRIIPIGERALRWIDKYVAEARPGLVLDANEQVLFITKAGEPFADDTISSLAADYLAQAKIGKKGACHLWRHTAATLMLEGGADIRHIQAMLGHADLTSTEVYTHVAIRALKAVHDRTHPGAKLDGRGKREKAQSGQEGGKQALLAALDSEDDEEP